MQNCVLCIWYCFIFVSNQKFITNKAKLNYQKRQKRECLEKPECAVRIKMFRKYLKNLKTH
ncbi:hypothetical protein KsCSTR_33640 [Candidatus Kuenenia stuttgartiensis]|uniref:Uncharacterized protein n=1 Tax=Kuenenia stuttgartiensis TaxID=174633 RepID=Q1Q4E1_KUEST|nr:hypothetical protein KsCSTR_33640 [Candidatus Kuenenia stuttgartiensis]CAJ74872.1 unknown protein [Candidatus Kuenenia stuttgartiensis]